MRKNIPVCTARVRHRQTTPRSTARLIATVIPVSEMPPGALIPDIPGKSGQKWSFWVFLLLDKSDESAKSDESGDSQASQHRQNTSSPQYKISKSDKECAKVTKVGYL